MRPRVFLDPKVRCILRRVFEPNDRFECQCPCRCREVDQGQAIAEHVVDPPDLGRTRRYLQSAFQQTLIKAVPRPEHELMRARPHGLPVPVRRRVMNGVNRHAYPKHSQTIDAAIATELFTSAGSRPLPPFQHIQGRFQGPIYALSGLFCDWASGDQIRAVTPLPSFRTIRWRGYIMRSLRPQIC